MRASINPGHVLAGKRFCELAAKTCKAKDSRLISKSLTRFTGRVEKHTNAGSHATVSRVTSQATGLLNLAYLKFEPGPDEWMLAVYWWPCP